VQEGIKGCRRKESARRMKTTHRHKNKASESREESMKDDSAPFQK
jgi:hypothetical protein